MAVRKICLVVVGTGTSLVVIRKRRSVPAAWTLPGSAIAADEEPFDAAVRIVADEVGVEVSHTAVRVYAEKRRVTKGSRSRHFRHFTVCAVELPDEHLPRIRRWNVKGDAVRVINRSEVDEYLSRSQRSFIGGLLES